MAEGAEINVVTAQQTSSKDAKPNDPVHFTVNEDVIVNGQLVVRKGTAALGSVINAEKRGYMGKSGKLAIQVESTQTVNAPAAQVACSEGPGRQGQNKQHRGAFDDD